MGIQTGEWVSVVWDTKDTPTAAHRDRDRNGHKGLTASHSISVTVDNRTPSQPDCSGGVDQYDMSGGFANKRDLMVSATCGQTREILCQCDRHGAVYRNGVPYVTNMGPPVTTASSRLGSVLSGGYLRTRVKSLKRRA